MVNHHNHTIQRQFPGHHDHIRQHRTGSASCARYKTRFRNFWNLLSYKTDNRFCITTKSGPMKCVFRGVDGMTRDTFICANRFRESPNLRRVHPSTVRPPRATLKAGRSGDGRSPQNEGFRAQILSPRGWTLGGSRHQPRRAVRLMGVYG